MRQAYATFSARQAESTATSSQVTLPTDMEALTQLSDWVRQVVEANRLPPRCAFRLELVLVEAVTNIIEHGGAAGIHGVIGVGIICEPGRIVAHISDSGPRFDPTALPAHNQPANLEDAPIGGLGVHLIRSYTLEWDYQRIDRTNQLCLTLACDE